MLQAHRPGETLLLGAQDGYAIGYGEKPSMLIIGPPGAGKTDCHAKMNVLTYEGSMVVLDIKGDIFDDTAGYKQAQGFRVLRYEPGADNPESHCYDPLDQIALDKDTIWEQCGQLTAYLFPDTPGERDPYWSLRARTLIQLLICATVVAEAEEDSTFSAILQALSAAGEIREALLKQLAAEARELQIDAMVRAADSFAGITSGEAKQLNSFFQMAMSRLAMFDSPPIERSMARSDWKPETLRDPPTIIYIIIAPEKVKHYSPLLRVVLGQHLDVLRRGAVEQAGLPVSFMIDEAPSLGNFETLIEAVETGRGYSIRCLIYAQTMGQLREKMAGGDSLMAMCGVRCFLNVQSADAVQVADELGKKVDIYTGRETPLVTPQELSGPAFEDKMVVLVNKSHPVMLDKISFRAQGGEIAEAAALPYQYTQDGYPPHRHVEDADAA